MKNPVDQYIVDNALNFFSNGTLIQERLQQIRDIAKNVFPPDVEEKIYHGVPAFILDGIDILCYGAYKNHITLYIGYDIINIIKKKYPEYQYSKTAIMIQYDEKMPDEVIKIICETILCSL